MSIALGSAIQGVNSECAYIDRTFDRSIALAISLYIIIHSISVMT